MLLLNACSMPSAPIDSIECIRLLPRLCARIVVMVSDADDSEAERDMMDAVLPARDSECLPGGEAPAAPASES
jgi:hypothetical protein